MGGAGQQGLGQRIACKNKSRNLTTGKKRKAAKVEKSRWGKYPGTSGDKR